MSHLPTGEPYPRTGESYTSVVFAVGHTRVVFAVVPPYTSVVFAVVYECRGESYTSAVFLVVYVCRVSGWYPHCIEEARI